jgi:hypothetical protein
MTASVPVAAAVVVLAARCVLLQRRLADVSVTGKP